ncbi:MAG: MarR family winged helix-turn-helix transcriptional regulator [Solirubrobacteraceae bacterium]
MATRSRQTPVPPTSPDATDDQERDLDQVGAAMFGLYRAWSRQQMRHVAPIGGLSQREATLGLVVQLIADSTRDPADEVTVGAVADAMDMDPSNASRLVAATVKAGYIARAASQHDGRRSILKLTRSGRQFLRRSRQHQRAVFEHITREWPDAERHQLARSLIRYVDDMAATRAAQAQARGIG